MRLIDADAFLKYILSSGIGKTIIEYSESNIGYMIRNRPTIDAVPVVRCKDCKYCNISLVLPTGRKMYNCMEGSHDHQTLLKSNDFCSRGEMRKDREYIDSEKKGGEEE